MKKLMLGFLFVVTVRFNSLERYYPGFQNVRPVRQAYIGQSYIQRNPYRIQIGSNPGVYYVPQNTNYFIWMR